MTRPFPICKVGGPANDSWVGGAEYVPCLPFQSTVMLCRIDLIHRIFIYMLSWTHITSLTTCRQIISVLILPFSRISQKPI